jgi:hypothetical protein
LRRAPAFNASRPDTDQKRAGLGQAFDPTGAGCGLQGTASSPSSTVGIIIRRRLKNGKFPARLEAIGQASTQNQAVPETHISVEREPLVYARPDTEGEMNEDEAVEVDFLLFPQRVETLGLFAR